MAKDSHLWALKCHLCEMEWSDRSKLSAMALHFELEHEGEPIHLDTVWKGKGPAPAKVENRASRRRQERKDRRGNHR